MKLVETILLVSKHLEIFTILYGSVDILHASFDDPSNHRVVVIEPRRLTDPILLVDDSLRSDGGSFQFWKGFLHDVLSFFFREHVWNDPRSLVRGDQEIYQDDESYE